MSGLPCSRKRCDSIWVIIEQLTKSAHFLPMKSTDEFWKLGQLFINKIVILHGVLVSIVSDRDPRFTSNFWGGLQKEFGTKLRFSAAFHPNS